MEVGRLGKWSSQDVARLVACLDKLPPVNTSQGFVSITAAEKLMDCVLSLHRKWDQFVVPRLKEYRRKCPHVNTLADLDRCVNESGGPVEFYREVIGYHYPEAAQMFDRVLKYLLKEMSRHPGTTDMERLAAWAKSAKTEGYRTVWVDANGRSVRIPMFGIAGWQYLRMLFDADTCKPDIAVKGFVTDCLKKKLSDVSVVEIMEAAAPLVPTLRSCQKPTREADWRIWAQYNRSKGRGRLGCHSS
jgi:hypothetical protein